MADDELRMLSIEARENIKGGRYPIVEVRDPKTGLTLGQLPASAVDYKMRPNGVGQMIVTFHCEHGRVESRHAGR